jgi:hypothetical protein
VVVVSAYLFREWVVQNIPGDADQESEVEQDDRYFTMNDDTHSNNDDPIPQHTAIGGDNSSIQLISPENGLLQSWNNKTNADSSGGLYADGIIIRNNLAKSQHDVQQETQQYQPQQSKITRIGHHRLGNDEDDEAEIESLMQSIMVQDPADALKRYSWNDLQNSNRTNSQQPSKSSPSTAAVPAAGSPLDQDSLVKNRRSSCVTTTVEDGLDRMESPLFSRGQCDLTTTMWTDLYKRQSTENWFPTGFPQTTNTQTATPPHIRIIGTDNDDDSVVDDPEHTTATALHAQPYSPPTAGSVHTAALDNETQLPFPSRQPQYANLDEDEDDDDDDNDDDDETGIALPSDNQHQQHQQQDHDIDGANDDPPLELFDVNDGHFDDEEDAFDLGGDIVGLLEAIGMRGNPWILLQNSILACILLTLFLAVVVWIPYTVGCLITLVRI